MTEVIFWGDTVTEDMLEFLQLGKAAALLARAKYYVATVRRTTSCSSGVKSMNVN